MILYIFLWIGLSRLVSTKRGKQQQPISVIIAARNEEKNIGALLRSLIDLNYPAGMFEIVVANDRSTDSTSSIVEKFLQSHTHIRLIDIESNSSDMPNKKNALRMGIEHSQFGILAFTDADCVVQKNWLNELSEQFTEETGAVVGYSPYQLNGASSIASSFLRYEEHKNSLLAAAAVGLDNAFLCTGRNFAYRKKVYDQVGGFEKIKHSVSGDDDLFLQLVRRETNWKIRYMSSEESHVRTHPPVSFSQFVSQRTRHVSGSKYYPRNIQLVYSMVHLFHVTVLVGLFFNPLISLIVLMTKFNLDGAFIAKGKTVFNEMFSVPAFFLNEILLVLYSFLIAPMGLIKKFEWKENTDQ